MAALLTSVGDNKDKAALYLGECRKLGIKVLSPDVNESMLNFSAVGNDVRFGLGGIRNVGENVVASIIRSREAKGRYESFPDFMNKVEMAVCNKRAIESLVKAGAFDSLGHARRALIEVHERAVDAVLDVKKQESIGQDSLFGMFEEEPGAPASVGFEVPGTPEWAQKVKLGFEREMLGLYVSSHPLDGAEPLLARNRDSTIAQLLSGERTEGEVRIAGIISKVDRRINKNSGAAWAIVTVEDLDAAVEVLFFPKVYPLYQNELVDDACVSVRGRLNERDGAISVFGQELVPLDLSNVGQAMPLQLTINARQLNQRSVAELGHILAAHPGPRPVRLTLQEPRSKVLFDLPGHPVEYSSALISEIKTLFGPNCVAV
jgi:DNA polymerase-3 subunit alpha